MNGVTHPFGPPSIFVMLGRKTVVVGRPGVPHGAAGAADSIRGRSSVVVAAATGNACAPSESASAQASKTATFLTAASMRELFAQEVLVA
jgi:hypothetical protein